MSLRAADCDTDHYRGVAKVRDLLIYAIYYL
jgi:hypothetical protein